MWSATAAWSLLSVFALLRRVFREYGGWAHETEMNEEQDFAILLANKKTCYLQGSYYILSQGFSVCESQSLRQLCTITTLPPISEFVVHAIHRILYSLHKSLHSKVTARSGEAPSTSSVSSLGHKPSLNFEAERDLRDCDVGR